MVISSLSNKKIMSVSKLHIKKYRNEEKRFIVEGEHLVVEAFNASLLEEVFILEDHDINCDVTKNYVTSDVMKKLSSLESISNVIGICRMPDNEISGDKILMLDGIQDPGNLGTIIRSAVAFNIDTIIASKNTVDLFNEKVLRSTQGMIFHINYVVSDLVEELEKLKEHTIYGTSLNLSGDLKSIKKSSKYVLIMGNEGSGVTDEVIPFINENIFIKMNDKCESLNVGVATGIILYELDK